MSENEKQEVEQVSISDEELEQIVGGVGTKTQTKSAKKFKVGEIVQYRLENGNAQGLGTIIEKPWFFRKSLYRVRDNASGKKYLVNSDGLTRIIQVADLR